MFQTATEQRPVIPAVSSRMSYEEFLERYDGIRAEWVDGKVELMSPVSNLHQGISNFLLRVIAEFVEVHQLGIVRYESFQMRLLANSRGREPDIMFIANDSLARLQTNFLDGPADLVVEIVSPESRDRDRAVKFAEYQAGGVREYWLLDPVLREANFYELEENGRYRFVPLDTHGVYHSTVLPGLWLREAWFWQSPPPLLSVVRKELGLP